MSGKFWVDCETSGLLHEHEIIQLACCIEHSNGMFSDMYDFKIKPYNMDIIDDRALKINNISREELETYESPEVVMGKLIEILKPYESDYYNRLTPSGYNTCFDVSKMLNFFARVYSPTHDLTGNYGVFYKEFYKYFNNRRYDVMVMINLIELKIGKSFKSHKLKDIYELFFPDDVMMWHDATTDIYATVKLNKLFLNILGIK